ncbi:MULTISPECIES: biotin--[acetyl-CoA-carboxylase] ligase [Paenibacillus]|uniref:Bifunctional ligase/repressor BirA n=1 Tax=Paenibacillus alvei TaxID=44250 RepID=A0ABT4EA41_PAEAL|nr:MULTISPECIES: biotin--[acetyl-CoA-carboxylase] ligase [Paenibacillus]EPY12388.1 biotin/acetyl-CoA-carboxylase ligase [Paenibacillus alvei A6-6i-x]MCY9530611.1 biotin--[acetyl-CoA-carboxylase] ligase [Paenibacillus alvei]SDE72000.1 BirA family transcriptional regulator, biotin operon repressor / biotin-[acetyl-CoA-carboxylase] ligase [Paenibacillus sp. cl6col]
MSDQLLAWFKEHPGEFISGEEISRRLDISRTAVWKQINRLRSKGYEFEAVPKLGYRLVQMPTQLDELSLLEKLKTSKLGHQLRIIARTESTQNEAAVWALEGAADGAVIIAEEQTGGRGRQGKSFHSPAGKGIWMSLILRPQIPLQFTPQLTLLSAVALCRAMKRMTDVDLGIKWPNDILYEDKKVCGILTESSAEDERLVHVIAGVGISVNLEEHDYPEELRSKVTSLKIASGKEIDRASLLAECLFELEQLYKLYVEQGFAPIRTLWEAQSVTIGRSLSVTTPNGIVSGVAQGLDDSGALIVLGEDGCYRKIFSGDVHFT